MVPILLVVFNRVAETKKLLDRLAEVEPPTLFVAADGPRQDRFGEVEECNAVRALFESLPWPCKVVRRFSEKNLGCGLAVSSAIGWFFSHVDEGIILEDDCVPSVTFFPFCERMLGKYRDDQRITHVGGFNCQEGLVWGDGDYYFSRYFHVWGWATWKRAWERFDLRMPDYERFRSTGQIRNVHPSLAVQKFWERNFDEAFDQRIDTWDYQWCYVNLRDHSIAIVPNKNLVSNIGFNERATHTQDSSVPAAKIASDDLVEVRDPSFVMVCNDADLNTYRRHVGLDVDPKAKGLVELLASAGLKDTARVWIVALIRLLKLVNMRLFRGDGS